MNSCETNRLILHAIDAVEAERIRDRAPSEADHWAEGYPFEGDLAAIGGFLRASDRHGEQRPFGYYQISLRSDGLAVGGIGFKGPPQDEVVEIGYGLILSARGRGYAAEALLALMTIAAEHGVRRVRADTAQDNVASQRTLERAGFMQVAGDDDLRHYEAHVVSGRTDRVGPSNSCSPQGDDHGRQGRRQQQP